MKNNIREFVVTPGVLGYTVRIGCQTAGFSNLVDLRVAINEYFDDPKGVEEKYYPSKLCTQEIRGPILASSYSEPAAGQELVNRRDPR